MTFFTLLGIGTSWSGASQTAAACDVITGSTFSVKGINTTLTSASITWTETYRKEKRFFCYGIGTPGVCAEVSSRMVGPTVQVVTGLTANTKYAFKFYLNYKSKIKSVITGSFITNNMGCGSTTVSTVEVDGFVLSGTGDSLENVLAKLTSPGNGEVIDQDTTDKYGHYSLSANPGNYLLNLVYLPYTPPAALPVLVEAAKPKTLPDQIMKNAFQLSGTVVSDGKGDSLVGAKITLNKQSDNSVIAKRTTDADGQFMIGVIAGVYLVNVDYQGKLMSPPMLVNVTKSTDLNKLVFKQSVKLFSPSKSNLGQARTNSVELFDLKGSSLEAALYSRKKLSPLIAVPWKRNN